MGGDQSADNDPIREPTPDPFGWDTAPPPVFICRWSRFGKYRLLEKIGEGGMGEVWRVWHVAIETERALKLIKPEIARNDEGWKSFEREVRLLIKIGHPNVVAVHDLKRTESAGYIEMELVRGRSLDEILEENNGQRMPLDWIRAIVAQLCAVLQEAHGYGIVHLDLKPSHLMIVDPGHPSEPSRLKVLGFGRSWLLEGGNGLEATTSGDLRGVPTYASPEQVRRTELQEIDTRSDLHSVLPSAAFTSSTVTEEIGTRSDLYSAAAIVYHLLTGKPPFGGSTTDVLAAHLHTPPPRMAAASPGLTIPPAIDRAVMQCLEKDPARRPRSARQLAEMFLDAAPEPTGLPETSPTAGSRAEPPSADASLLDQIIEATRQSDRSPREDLQKLVNEIVRGNAPPDRDVLAKIDDAIRAIEGQLDLTDSPSALARLTALREQLRDLQSRCEGSKSLELLLKSITDRDTRDISAVTRSSVAGTKLYVGNLTDQMSSSDLEQLFDQYGIVVNTEVLVDPATGRSKGFGFVEMASRDDAHAAIAALNDREINGRRLTVNTARPREDRRTVGVHGHGQRQGGYGGPGGGYGGGRRPVQQKTIRRHTDVSFPARVRVGKFYNLRVQIVPAEETLPSGEVRERPRPPAHDATVDLTVPTPVRPEEAPPPIRLIISVAGENFEIDGPNRMELVVPLDGKSPAVPFGMRGQEVGPGRIMLDFAQDGRPVGSVDLTPEVVADVDAPQPLFGPAPAWGALALDLGLGPTTLSPDVVLKVFDHRLSGRPGRLQFVLSSRHPALSDLPVLDGDLGTLDLCTDVAGWVGDQLRAIDALVAHAEPQADDVGRTLATAGFNLYQQLLPPAVQELSWTLRRHGIKTLLILSDDPHIPWELIKPFRADPLTGAIVSEDDFWGESFALAHWLRGRPPASRFSVKRVLGIATTGGGATEGSIPRTESSASEFGSAVGRDMSRIKAGSDPIGASGAPGAGGSAHPEPAAPVDQAELGLGVASLGPLHGQDGFSIGHLPLSAVDEELELLRTLEAVGARVERLPALRGSLRRAFEEGSFDLLHLVSHGSFGGTAHGDASAVLLDDGLFTAAELSPFMAAAMRRVAPLVIFNTCHCGRLGFSLTRLGSWGAQLVQLGCGGFIGALWPVSDRAALVFARALYEELARNCPVAEAVRLARLQVRERYPGDPTWLAYCCFADPMARIEPEMARRY